MKEDIEYSCIEMLECAIYRLTSVRTEVIFKNEYRMLDLLVEGIKEPDFTISITAYNDEESISGTPKFEMINSMMSPAKPYETEECVYKVWNAFMVNSELRDMVVLALDFLHRVLALSVARSHRGESQN